jgi:hypothetical protein
MASLGGTSVPDTIESHNLLTIAQEGETPRPIALCGNSADNWQGSSSDDVLFHAFDGEWCLGVTRDREMAPLCRLGSHDDLASENLETVDRLYTDSIDEIERRGADPALTEGSSRTGKHSRRTHN